LKKTGAYLNGEKYTGPRGGRKKKKCTRPSRSRAPGINTRRRTKRRHPMLDKEGQQNRSTLKKAIERNPHPKRIGRKNLSQKKEIICVTTNAVKFVTG